MEKKQEINFSLAGCGFLGMYLFGVAACIKKYAPHLVLQTVSGASAGAFAAMALAADVPISEAANIWINACDVIRKKVIGPFSPSSDVPAIARYHLERCVPEDAHLRVNGRVNISLTRARDMQNVVISHFESREELIDGLLCAICIPFFVGIIPPKFRGERYIDGGFTVNILIHNEHTVTVSPYCGKADICPRDAPTLSPWVLTAANTSIEISTQNLYRMTNTFIPPRPARLAQLYRQGYEDMFTFLMERRLVGCTRCILPGPQDKTNDCHTEGYDTSFTTKENQREKTELGICTECESIREIALEQISLDPIIKIFEKAIADDEEEQKNSIWEYKIIKLMSLATLPLAISYDFVYATGIKLKTVPGFILPHLTIPKILAPHLVAFQEALIPLPW